MKSVLFPVLIALSLSAYSLAHSAVKKLSVSNLFSDQMVLQQKKKVNFWGQLSPGKKLVITASWGKQVSTIADNDGNWNTKLLTPAAGGPYTITIQAADTNIVIKDVLIGEVWLASGQSNMDIPLRGWPPEDTILNSKQEINDANYPTIRFMKVPFNISASPLKSVNAKWVTISPETAGDFSATAYFFARRLQQVLHVPIGIIQSSMGGTPAEAWTSKDYLEKLGDFNQEIDGLENLQTATDSWFAKWPLQTVPKTIEEWLKISFSDSEAANPAFDDSNWSTVKFPGRFDLVNSTELDGAVWLRKEFAIPDNSTDYVLKIGAVDDMDAVYINGKYLGGIVGEGHATTVRKIVIPKSLLLKGKNFIAIRAIDTGGKGSISGEILISNNKGDTISLAGEWKSLVVAELLNGKFHIYGLHSDIYKRPNISKLNSNSPTVLFNAMINPLIPYTIKGVIWYQGESNVGRAEQYKKLFPLMIQDWRKKWDTNLPFYYVQIAPFLYSAPDQRGQSQKLRDAQRNALKLPKTGMVSTLDIGYLKTAHPPYKQEVGGRLAKFAFNNEYGIKQTISGPLFKKVTVNGNKLIVRFDFARTGLIANKMIDNFEVAGADKVYVKAEVQIENNKLLVSSVLVANPVYVRYAWSDGSSATLFNKEGLPAATFTSENE